MLGWRGRIGYVSPSTIQLPWELQDMLPDGVGVVATVLSVRVHTEEAFRRALEGVEEAVRIVAGEGAQAVMLGGVPVAVRQGYHGEQESLRGLRERTGVPVISGVAAAVEGLRHLGARRPVVATAYLDEINQGIMRYLAEADLEPAGIAGLQVRSPAEASRVQPWQYYRLARDLLAAHPDADSLFLGSRGNIQDIVLRLERDSGLPVLTGTQAGLWWALRQIGVRAPLHGQGRLFEA
jgi:maleate isomerase